MFEIKQQQAKKIAYGIVGLAGGTLAMKAIEKALGSQTVAGFLGLEGVVTMQSIAPPLVVGILGAGYYSSNSTKDSGFIGLGAAMAAGAKAIEKVANQTIFSGLNASDDAEYIEGYSNYSGAALEDLEGTPVIDVL